MSYLLTQMFLYLLVAFLLGLLLGWLIWRYGKASGADLDAMRAERDKLAKERDGLKTDLASCRAQSERDRDALDGMRTEKIDLETQLTAMGNRAAPAPVAAVSAPAAPVQGTKPEGISAPRGGMADDLKRISGVGPTLEKMLHGLGYFHFDQIAAWGASDVAWVDENLEGFKGRVSRDNWVSQAQELARG
jgi:predicted flap endonuclease-1-like 5' DNA nuclease